MPADSCVRSQLEMLCEKLTDALVVTCYDECRLRTARLVDQQRHDPHAVYVVEIGRRLVRQNDQRFIDKRARDCDALRFSET